MSLSGICPICESSVLPKQEVEESEILSCPDCNSMLVVELVQNNALFLKQAPKIEEDWGE